MKKVNGCIYLVENKINGKLYVGQTINFERRKKQHFAEKNNFYFKNALLKYGKENFDWKIIYSCNVLILENGKYDKSELNEKEKFYISYYKTNKSSTQYDGSNGYNLNDGGKGNIGHTVSEEAKLKISLANKGNIPSKYNREMSSLANKGKVVSKKTRLKISQIKKGHSVIDETKQKISESNIKTNLEKINKAIPENIKQKLKNGDIKKLFKKENKANSIKKIYKKRTSNTEKQINSLALKGNTNSRDKKVYTFVNLVTKEEFIGTRYDFSKKYQFKLSSISDLFRRSNKSKSFKKWVVFEYNKNNTI